MTLALIFTTGSVFAQDAAEADMVEPITSNDTTVKKQGKSEQKKEDSSLKLSGRIWMDYWMRLDDNNPADKTTHGLRLTRTYLTVENKINDMLMAKLVIDGAPSGTGGTTTTYDVFVKNAYLEANTDLYGAFGSMKILAGLTGTPVIGLVDDLSDYRWIYQNYIDRAADLGLSGKDGNATTSESSADLGITGQFNIMKMVTITGMYANGEGFNKVESGDYPEKANTGKSYYGVVTFNPEKMMKELNINVFARYKDVSLENNDATSATASRTNLYYGGGAAWKSDLIKAGVHYLMGTDDDESTVKINYTLLDSYINANLESIIDIPVLIMGRFAMGDSNTGIEDNERYIIAAGAGYQINKNFRTLLYFQQTSYTASDTDPDRMVWLKTDIKF